MKTSIIAFASSISFCFTSVVAKTSSEPAFVEGRERIWPKKVDLSELAQFKLNNPNIQTVGLNVLLREKLLNPGFGNNYGIKDVELNTVKQVQEPKQKTNVLQIEQQKINEEKWPKNDDQSNLALLKKLNPGINTEALTAVLDNQPGAPDFEENPDRNDKTVRGANKWQELIKPTQDTPPVEQIISTSDVKEPDDTAFDTDELRGRWWMNCFGSSSRC